MTQCDAVWHSVTQYDTLWRSMTQCDAVWHSVTQYDTVWHGVTQCDTMRRSVTQCDAVWHNVTRSAEYDTLWHTSHGICTCRCNHLWVAHNRVPSNRDRTNSCNRWRHQRRRLAQSRRRHCCLVCSHLCYPRSSRLQEINLLLPDLTDCQLTLHTPLCIRCKHLRTYFLMCILEYC